MFNENQTLLPYWSSQTSWHNLVLQGPGLDLTPSTSRCAAPLPRLRVATGFHWEKPKESHQACLPVTGGGSFPRWKKKCFKICWAHENWGQRHNHAGFTDMASAWRGCYYCTNNLKHSSTTNPNYFQTPIYFFNSVSKNSKCDLEKILLKWRKFSIAVACCIQKYIY